MIWFGILWKSHSHFYFLPEQIWELVPRSLLWNTLHLFFFPGLLWPSSFHLIGTSVIDSPHSQARFRSSSKNTLPPLVRFPCIPLRGWAPSWNSAHVLHTKPYSVVWGCLCPEGFTQWDRPLLKLVCQGCNHLKKEFSLLTCRMVLHELEVIPSIWLEFSVCKGGLGLPCD